MRGNGAVDLFQLRNIAADRLQIGAAFFQAALHQKADQALRQIHEIVECRIGHFRLDHPEFGQMAARLRFLRAERWAERIHLAQRHGRGFDVELAGLREIRLLVEVIDREQRGRAFASGWSQNRRIGQREAALVEKVAGSLDDLGAHAQDRRLARRAHPEMAVLHQEFDAMLFQRNRERIVLRHALQHLHVRNVEFVSAGRALVGAHFAFDDHARFLRQALDRVEYFGGHRVLWNHSLNHAAAVAKNGEEKLSAFAQVVEPAANGDGLAVVLADFRDCRDMAMSFAEPFHRRARRVRPRTMTREVSAILGDLGGGCNSLTLAPAVRKSRSSSPPD